MKIVHEFSELERAFVKVFSAGSLTENSIIDESGIMAVLFSKENFKSREGDEGKEFALSLNHLSEIKEFLKGQGIENAFVKLSRNSSVGIICTANADTFEELMALAPAQRPLTYDTTELEKAAERVAERVEKEGD